MGGRDVGQIGPGNKQRANRAVAHRRKKNEKVPPRERSTTRDLIAGAHVRIAYAQQGEKQKQTRRCGRRCLHPLRTVISAVRKTPCPISILLGVLLVSSSSRAVRFVGMAAGATPAGGDGGAGVGAGAVTAAEFWVVRGVGVGEKGKG